MPMNTLAETDSIPGVAAGERTSSRGVVLLCYLGFLLSFGDRVIFSMVLKPIKASLHFTDSQLGLLVGLAFAIAYGIFSILSGYVVDRFSRKAVMVSAIGFWSAMTLMTGLANSFLMMAAARAFVGAGAAFMHPLAMSLISDAVPQQRRPRVFSFYVSAAAVGAVLALLLGGTLLHLLTGSPVVTVPGFGSLASWRVTFLCAAVPGLLLILLILLFMREPHRAAAIRMRSGSTGEVLAFSKRNWRLLLAMMFGIALCQVPAATSASFIVLFFGRVHGWTVARAALQAGAPAAAMALLGCLAAGPMIQWLRRRGYADAPIRVAVAGGLIFTALSTAGVLVGNELLAAGLLITGSFFTYLPGVSMYSSLGEVFPPATRGRFTGNMLAVGIFTTSLGPSLVGLFSDHVFRTPTGLGKALALTFTSVSLVAILIALSGMRFYRRRMAEIAEDRLVTG